MPTSAALKHFVARLNVAERVPRPANEEWKAMIARISTPGKIAEIDRQIFMYFLEVLPPKFQSDGLFAFAEGAEELRLFWRDDDNRYWVRQLTWTETQTFCRFAGILSPLYNKGEPMDPQATWDQLLAAYVAGDWDVIEERAHELLEWLDRGGFPPKILQIEDIDPEWNSVLAQAGCHYALASMQSEWRPLS